MDADFKLYGSHGYVQVDSSIGNFSLRQTGTISGVTTVTFANATSPLIAFRSLSAGVKSACVRTRYSGGSALFDCQVLSGSAQYYVFDKPANTAASVGLTIWDSSGQVSFSSDQAPMNIVGYTVIPDGTPRLTTPVSVSASAGTYAGCILGPRGEDYDPVGPPHVLYVDAVDTTSTTVTQSGMVLTSGTVSAMYQCRQGGILLLLNVVNL